ncbi:uncharacterized protein LOC114316766 [Camellia sinensis]|uniref:uncharacterized protein LOC114316766 n=1 Tax=Camellia sinensis TaxID=4442 RepID=UPI0010366984|nr:uncharacterized protein LOC114316766 [Camellia sinensis]
MSSPLASVNDPHRKSLEEEDHMIRSTKKIKGKDEMGAKDMETNDASTSISPISHCPGPTRELSPSLKDGTLALPKPKSFKDALAAPKSNDFYFDDVMDTISPEEEAEERDADIPEAVPQGIPRISLPKQLLQQIRQPWTNSLIVRLLGKNIGYRLLCTKVRNLWALQDEFNAIDLGNNNFVFKFSSQEDCAHVYSGGPWVILDHYLIVRKWEPDFKASEAFETTTAVWVRFPKLPIEYFQEKVLYTIAKQLGRPLKLDLTTALATRGKFARGGS